MTDQQHAQTPTNPVHLLVVDPCEPYHLSVKYEGGNVVAYEDGSLGVTLDNPGHDIVPADAMKLIVQWMVGRYWPNA